MIQKKAHIVLLGFFGAMFFLVGCSALQIIKPRLSGPTQTAEGVTFQYFAPSAQQVNVAGDFNSWASGNHENAVNLQKTDEGVWSAVVKLEPGRYKYKFVIDGQKWEKDPNGENANDPDDNSLVIVE